MELIIFLGLVVAVAVLIVSLYNRLVTLRNRFKNAFAQIDVQLKRRHDLIPNLVKTAKAYMKHEQETLERVIQARNSAAQAQEKASSNPADPTSMQRLLGAETSLNGALANFFALSENYPDLKASQNMQQLTEELTTTENRIAYARQAYNDAVMFYNTAREKFPSNIVATSFAFQPAISYEVESSKYRESPTVTFS